MKRTVQPDGHRKIYFEELNFELLGQAVCEQAAKDYLDARCNIAQGNYTAHAYNCDKDVSYFAILHDTEKFFVDGRYETFIPDGNGARVLKKLQQYCEQKGWVIPTRYERETGKKKGREK